MFPRRPAWQTLLVPIALLSAAAVAEPRDYCPDRPGIGNPSCTLEPGRFSFETGVVDWSRDRVGAGTRESDFVFGDLLLRYGIADHAEVQIGGSSFAIHEERGGGTFRTRKGVGDAFLAIRRNLLRPDGSGTSVAAMLYATLPTGGATLGAGDWSTGLQIPMSFEIDDRVSLSAMPSLAADVDEDGTGRHLAYGAVVGLTDKLSDALSATIEYQLERDREQGSHLDQHVAGLSLAVQSGDDLQFDVGVNAGLNHAATDVQLYAGISRRFR